MDAAGHDQHITREFTKQAATFEDESLNMAFTIGLPWLLEHVAPLPGWRVLDVAAGTGLVARALAEAGCTVVALDRVEPMLRAGRPRFPDTCRAVLGAAERLPFPNGAFDAVVTRFSLHHMVEPRPVLAEMLRVCRAGGRLVVKDLVASTDPDVAARQDRVESLRDPSHLRMPASGAVAGWLAGLGARVERQSHHDLDRPVEPWLRQSETPAPEAAEVRRALEGELAGGEPTGMRPHRRDGDLWFHQTWEVTAARR